MKNKVIVKVIEISTKKLPFDFPWINGVAVNLLGDTENLDNLVLELKEVRKMVLRDINRFGLNLSDFTIQIKSKGE